MPKKGETTSDEVKKKISISRKIKKAPRFCLKCNKKLKYSQKKFCSLDCFYKHHIGKNHGYWKGGISKIKCIDCNVVIGQNKTGRCRSCYVKFNRGENHGAYKNGSALNCCLDCGKIVGKPKRCRPCFDIQNKGLNNHMCGKGGEKHNCWDSSKISNSCNSCGKDLGRFSDSKVCINCYVGDKTPNWRGGISNEKYCDIWLDKEYKQSILERDNHECQNPDCRKTSDVVVPHHIDYNKLNCHPWNLITLCGSCNPRANKNRNYWQKLYQNIIEVKYGSK